MNPSEPKYPGISGVFKMIGIGIGRMAFGLISIPIGLCIFLYEFIRWMVTYEDEKK
jgi:hypothetical protein